MSFIQAFLITGIYAVATFLEPWLAFPMLAQPLVLGPLVGLVLGDVTTGVLCGATCQMIFLGIMGIGGTTPPDPAVGTVVGTAFAITLGQSVEVALTIAVPAAIIGQFLFLLGAILRGLFNPYILKLIERGDYKKIEHMHFWATVIPAIPGYIVNFCILYFGAKSIQGLAESLPAWLVEGLGVATGMMAAVGIALLLRMMWSKKMSVYFFAGFLLVTFLKIPLIGVAALAVVLVVILYLEGNHNASMTAVAKTEEEALFND